jgi:hypothetical protein
MPRMLGPFQFVLVAVAGWMNQRQQQNIEYLREENRVLREQLGASLTRVTQSLLFHVDAFDPITFLLILPIFYLRCQLWPATCRRFALPASIPQSR